ncbi:MAG: exodeoxyribonuclease III [Polyangiaceae bacterium]
MKIATWNVNGIRARQAQLEAWLAEERPDVLCLQEIKAVPEQIPASLLESPDHHTYWHGGKGYSGVAILVRRDFSAERPEFSHPAFDLESRVVVARIGDLSVASVYVPNGGKDYVAKIQFLEALSAFAATFRMTKAPLVLCGDLNVARTDIDVHPKERKANCIGQLPEEREIIEKILGEGQRDIARDLHPDDAEFFTWWAPWRNMRQRNIGWRIDYILASAPLAEKAKACTSQREVGTSDHAPLVATFD